LGLSRLFFGFRRKKTFFVPYRKEGGQIPLGEKERHPALQTFQTQLGYNGQAKKPTVKVTSSGKSVPASGFTLSYKNNTKVGIATIVVKGTGEYKGLSGEASFKITLKTTSFKTCSSKAAGSISTSWTPDTQADGYHVWFSTNQSFSKPIKETLVGGKKGSLEKTGLTSGKKYYVRIRSYKEVNGQEWVSTWSSVREVMTK
jgi:hypothetical protein